MPLEIRLIVTTGVSALDKYSQEIGKRLEVDKVMTNPPARWRDTTLRDTYRFIRIMRKGGRKLLHLPNQHLGRYAVFCSCPFILTIHDLIRFYILKDLYDRPPLKESFYLMLDGLAFKKAKHFIAISESTKRDIIEYLKIPEQKITVIDQGVDHRLYYPRREHLPDLEYVLFVGSEEPRKNLGTMLKAFFMLKKDKAFSNLKLVKVGDPRSERYRQSTLKVITDLGLHEDVSFTGFVSDEELALYYSNAGCLLFPSLYEGFGLPPLEAMACGCPVVTSNTSSLPEVVGEAGIMVNPYDTNGLAKAIREVLTNSKLRDDMVRKGLEQAKKFSWEKAARQTLEVYNKLAGE